MRQCGVGEDIVVTLGISDICDDDDDVIDDAGWRRRLLRLVILD